MSALAFFLGVKVGATLPPHRFFKPNRKFAAYMAANCKRTLLYDVGAGAGHVARALAKTGVRVKAIDLYRQTGAEFPVTIADAVTHKYQAGSVVMFCRPSHEGFVNAAIVRAKRCGVGRIVYVGLRRNLGRDLGLHGGKFCVRLVNVGAAGEILYVWPTSDGRREQQ